eukprot:2795565-Rhodomonas_salina.1
MRQLVEKECKAGGSAGVPRRGGFQFGKGMNSAKRATFRAVNCNGAVQLLYRLFRAVRREGGENTERTRYRKRKREREDMASAALITKRSPHGDELLDRVEIPWDEDGFQCLYAPTSPLPPACVVNSAVLLGGKGCD